MGIHPWYIDAERLELDLEVMSDKLHQNNALAVGECGLDKRIDTPLDVQRRVFESQIELAEKFRKPMVLHLVAAYQELIDIKKQKKVSVPMVVHGFSKNIQTANQLLSHDLYLSFGKYLLQNPELAEVFAQIPNDRIFLETDTLDQPIETVYETAARAKNVTVPQLQEIVWDNFNRIFIHTSN